MKIKSFDHRFEECENESNNINLEDAFNNFRSSPTIYNFLASKRSNALPNTEAEISANNKNKELADLYRKAKKHIIGYDSNRSTFKQVDNLDSYHILMNTIIFSNIGKHINTVVEIGGGFGNFIRLNNDIVDINSWTIVDLAFVIKLQKWYLNHYDLNIPVNFVEGDNLDVYNNWLKSNSNKIDLTIATDSMSEIDYEKFLNYFNDIVLKSKYFFYATHKMQPNKHFNRAKIDMIKTHFDLVEKQDYKKSYLMLFKKK